MHPGYCWNSQKCPWYVCQQITRQHEELSKKGKWSVWGRWPLKKAAVGFFWGRWENYYWLNEGISISATYRAELPRISQAHDSKGSDQGCRERRGIGQTTEWVYISPLPLETGWLWAGQSLFIYLFFKKDLSVYLAAPVFIAACGIFIGYHLSAVCGI